MSLKLPALPLRIHGWTVLAKLSTELVNTTGDTYENIQHNTFFFKIVNGIDQFILVFTNTHVVYGFNVKTNTHSCIDNKQHEYCQ